MGLDHGRVRFMPVRTPGQGQEFLDPQHPSVGRKGWSLQNPFIPGAEGFRGPGVSPEDAAGQLELGTMGRFPGTRQHFHGHLMGHFMQENFPHGIPGMVMNEGAAQGNFPLFLRPGTPAVFQVPKTEERKTHSFSLSGA